MKRQALIDFLRDDEKGGGRIFSNEFFAPTDVSDDLPAGRVRTVICKSGFHFIDFSYMHPGARAISQLDNVEPAMEEYLQYFRRYRSDAL